MQNSSNSGGRRGFLQRALGFAGLSSLAPAAATAAETKADGQIPSYARAQNYRSLKQSSFDTTGGNGDRWLIPGGGSHEIFNAQGPGVISHIWFTIAAQNYYHLKELVLRAWWDGASKPSIEAPLGDFFGLNLGTYHIYESAYLACSPGKSLNCYFAMPYRRSARMTVTNEGKDDVRAFYSNIDYKVLPSVPEDMLYFHAQYRQQTPCVANTGSRINLDGKLNYVIAEAQGRGHIMGVTLGVLQNADGWWGEGDDMIFVDDEKMPVITGTGSEDYFLGSWDFGGRDGAQAFAHRYYGAQFIMNAERTGGRYLCYRWHGDNPVTFNRYMKYTMEHGHANDRHDNWYSTGYWYQDKPHTDFPAMPPLADRIPKVKA